MLKIKHFIILTLAVSSFASCAKDYALVGSEREQGRTPIWMSTNVALMTTRAITSRLPNTSISTTTTDWESKISTLRLIISDSQTGVIVYNVKTSNPQEIEQRYVQTKGETARWNKPFQIAPGKYDFWFIANEGTNWYAPVTSDHDGASAKYNAVWDKLAVGTNIARIFDGKVFGGTDAPLSHLDIAPYRKFQGRDKVWAPLVNPSDFARDYPMPMSAVYKNITVTNERRGKGKSEQDPQHFVAGGDEVVKLMRCMAKVTFVLKGAAYINSNRTIRDLQWPWLGKFSIMLLNRPRYWSFFNTPLFDMNHKPREFKFYSDIFDDQSRIPMIRLGTAGRAPVNYQGIDYTASDVSQNEDDLKDYQYTFYVPELLLEKDTRDGEINGGQAADPLKAVMLSFAPRGTAFTNRGGLWVDNPSEKDGKAYLPFSGAAEFLGKIRETKAFNIGTGDLAEADNNTDNPRLPNPQLYSKFSLLRNRHYIYTIREKKRLQVDVRIAPWEADEQEGERLVYHGFNVMVSDPSFSNAQKQTDVLIQMTDLKPGVKRVKLTLLNQDGKTNGQAYFSNVGGMEAESGSQPKWVGFGNTADMKKDGGYAKCTINWNGASGVNAPMVGKAFVKIEYFSDDDMHYLIGGPSADNPETIVVRPTNWASFYNNL